MGPSINPLQDHSKCEPKGIKSLPEPFSVRKVILMMVLHACQKIMFFDTRLKVGIYLASLFVISLLADVLPFPKTYFARKDNIFEVYFAKNLWQWTLLVSVPFVALTSSTYCCRRRDRVVKHLIRLAIASTSLFVWMKFFKYIKGSVGRCNAGGERIQTKSACLERGLFWQKFDISGHTFIFMYSGLVLIEEARAIIGWEGIEDLLRIEEHSRANGSKEISCNPLRNLNPTDFDIVKFNYERYTPFIRGLFISMTALVILCDVMLLSTLLYFHTMVEKFLSGCIAIFMWYVTYKFWYTLPNYLPQMPGEGLFKYKDSRPTREMPLAKRSKSIDKGQLPRFMGMPLYGLREMNCLKKSQKHQVVTTEYESV